MNSTHREIKDKIIEGYRLGYDEAVALSKTHEKIELYQCANEIRRHFCGDVIDLCSITNAKSGNCSEDCKWCSQSAHHQTDIDKYSLIDKKQAVAQGLYNRSKGINRYSLVTSGRALSDKDLDELLEVYYEVKERSDIHLCASMGLLQKPQLEKLKSAGIEHYHCNLESAPSYFDEVCTTHSIEEKIETIRYARELGLKICSGGIIGMGETMEQRIEMACLLRELEVESIPINILTPIEGTELQDAPPLSKEEVLTTIALFRFINPTAQLRFGGGRMLIKEYQKEALLAGMNAAISGDLLTTIGSSINEDKVAFQEAGFTLNRS